MRYGCQNGLPHTYELDYEDPIVQAEQCSICGHRIKFYKDKQGRVDNEKYLKAHIREFCQPHGATAKLYYQLYHPELYEQNRHLWTLYVCPCGPKDKCHHFREKKKAYIGDIRKKGTNAK